MVFDTNLSSLAVVSKYYTHSRHALVKFIEHKHISAKRSEISEKSFQKFLRKHEKKDKHTG